MRLPSFAQVASFVQMTSFAEMSSLFEMSSLVEVTLPIKESLLTSQGRRLSLGPTIECVPQYCISMLCHCGAGCLNMLLLPRHNGSVTAFASHPNNGETRACRMHRCTLHITA